MVLDSSFEALTRAWDRTQRDKEESDTAYFYSLLSMGELVTKLCVAAFASALDDDKDRARYQLIHQLVRADGIGEWGKSLTTILTGPPAQFLCNEAYKEQNELLSKSSSSTWQHESYKFLNKALTEIHPSTPEPPTKISALDWFKRFAELRNKTRGHGAILSETTSRACMPLEQSLRIFIENFSFFKREWAYVKRNYSGKYRVTRIGSSSENFNHLKNTYDINIPDGVYVFLDKPRLVELLNSDADLTDFYLPNGGFTGKSFELISYLTGDIRTADATPYLAPATGLPSSETEGTRELECNGNVLTNLPAEPFDYVSRPTLEQEIESCLLNDRHPVISLVGRGGIGKTSIALRVLHRIAQTERFTIILWFSARDIDLRPEGPKTVKAKVLDVKDIASEYARLIGCQECKDKTKNPEDYFSAALTNNPEGVTLFVFDNFETTINPEELYTWLDTFIRPPNKILITTRHRTFRGDFSIPIQGMSHDEASNLIHATAKRLGIADLLTDDIEKSIITESEGHPYVIKILLGEISDRKRKPKVARIMADKESILTALFERTYTQLSPAAQRLFLTLCNWNSAVPLVALQAVLLQVDDGRFDIPQAVEELERFSFIERKYPTDEQEFISVPVSASLFGKRKLSVSPIKSAVENDTKFLIEFGATSDTGVSHGISPHIKRFISFIRRQLSNGANLGQFAPMLETIAHTCPSTWLDIASLYEDESIDKSIDAIQRYLEYASDKETRAEAWDRLAYAFRTKGDTLGEVHALVEKCALAEVDYQTVSRTANRFNSLLRTHPLSIQREEKLVLARKLIEIMENGIAKADATDLSRLAWLYAHVGDEPRALEHVMEGLHLDPDNEYCLRLNATLESRHL